MAQPFLIVGAGVAGLAAAVALCRAGRDVVILERRPEITAEGAGIQIGPNGTRILADLGVLEALRPAASAPLSIRVHRGSDGQQLAMLPLGTWIGHRHGSPYWVIHRVALVTALFKAAIEAGARVHFGATLDRLEERATGVAVELSDGRRFEGAGLIGADGLWSRVRSIAFDGDTWRESGLVATRGILRGDAVPHIRRDAVSLWLAPDAHLVTYPIDAGASVNVVLITRGDAPIGQWSVPVPVNEVRRRFHGDRNAPRFTAAVGALEQGADTWRAWPLVNRPPLASYAHGRIALIGDAAHPMLPFLAQGGVMALEDAVSLASMVSANAASRPTADVTGSFAAYSRARLARTQRVVAAAERNGRWYHLNGFRAHLRDLALTLTPGPLVMRTYDWLYGGPTEVAV